MPISPARSRPRCRRPRTPFKGLEGFAFGLANEPFLPRALKAEDFTTDAKGEADVELKADALPDTSHPLEVALRATVNDVDGRPAVAQATSALHTGDRFVGIRRGFKDLADGATAGFDVALVDGDGAAIPGETLTWSLVKEDYTYSYFYRDGRWQSHEAVVDARIDGGTLALDGHGRGTLSTRVGNGRWRMEVYDASGTTASSVRFDAGWWAADEAENRKPETMPVTLDAHPPEGKVRAMIEPSFAGRVLVMLDGNGLHGVQEVEMAKGGGAVEFDAADVPASGGYVLAMAVSPSGAVIPRLPVRAVGIAWVPGRAAARKLDVTLGAPAKLQPKTTLAVDVVATGTAPGEEAWVTLAAVDEAVLRMTSFAAPDPSDHYPRPPRGGLRDPRRLRQPDRPGGQSRPASRGWRREERQPRHRRPRREDLQDRRPLQGSGEARRLGPRPHRAGGAGLLRAPAPDGDGPGPAPASAMPRRPSPCARRCSPNSPCRASSPPATPRGRESC